MGSRMLDAHVFPLVNPATLQFESPTHIDFALLHMYLSWQHPSWFWKLEPQTGYDEFVDTVAFIKTHAHTHTHTRCRRISEWLQVSRSRFSFGSPNRWFRFAFLTMFSRNRQPPKTDTPTSVSNPTGHRATPRRLEPSTVMATAC